jgi:isocitrate lyase
MSDVERLRGSVKIEYTLAELGAKRLWNLLHTRPFVAALGAFTGNQAMQMVKAGLEAIYLSGWQVAADANLAGHMYPDQSLYPANSVPAVVKRINEALRRADQIQHMEGKGDINFFAPIVADAEAGFGGPLNAFELMKAMIEAGAAAVHFEDQLASEKKCGHLGGKVLVPISGFIRTLNAARLGADVCGTSTLVVARTDAEAAQLITSDVDERDHRFIDRDVKDARRFAEAIQKEYPGKMMAYNCSPSFNWKANLDEATIANFQKELGAMGYKFQFVTLASFHNLNYTTFELAKGYAERGMAAYSELQQKEFAAEKLGFTAVKHQREVGTGYFDAVSMAISGGESSTTALKDSTEEAQFH